MTMRHDEEAIEFRSGLMPDDPRHGTRNGYSGLGCRCGLCRIASADYESGLRARRRASGVVPDRVHGTLTGYTSWGCKCVRCRAAATENSRKRRERERQVANEAMEVSLVPMPSFGGLVFRIDDGKELGVMVGVRYHNDRVVVRTLQGNRLLFPFSKVRAA